MQVMVLAERILEKVKTKNADYDKSKLDKTSVGSSFGDNPVF